MHDAFDPVIFGPNNPCFGCSPTHPHGLHLTFTRDDARQEVVTTFTPGEHHQGPPGVMHGGLVTALADEIAAWAIIGGHGKFGFTAAMEARFKQPARLGVPIEARATIPEHAGRVVKVKVRLTQAGVAIYEGDFTFAVLDRAGAERMIGGPLPAAWERFAR